MTQSDCQPLKQRIRGVPEPASHPSPFVLTFQPSLRRHPLSRPGARLRCGRPEPTCPPARGGAGEAGPAGASPAGREGARQPGRALPRGRSPLPQFPPPRAPATGSRARVPPHLPPVPGMRPNPGPRPKPRLPLHYHLPRGAAAAAGLRRGDPASLDPTGTPGVGDGWSIHLVPAPRRRRLPQASGSFLPARLLAPSPPRADSPGAGARGPLAPGSPPRPAPARPPGAGAGAPPPGMQGGGGPGEGASAW